MMNTYEAHNKMASDLQLQFDELVKGQSAEKDKNLPDNFYNLYACSKP